MANKGDKLIKDLVIKVKAGDIDSAAKSAEKLSNALTDSAAGGEMLDSSLKRVPETLKYAVSVANDLKKTISSKLSGNLVGQFGAVNSELTSVATQLSTIGKLSSGSISFKGLGTSSNSAKKLADNLLDAAAAAELLEHSVSKVSLELIEAMKYSDKLKTNLSTSVGDAGFERVEGQLAKLNDTVELVLGSISEMGQSMDKAGANIVERLDDINSGTELVRRGVSKTTAAMDKMGSNTLNKNLDKTNNSIEKTSRGLGNMNNHAQGATRTFSKMAKVGGSLSIAYAMIAANVFALSEAWAYLSRGDALTRMEKASNNLAASTGRVTNDMVNMIQEVSGFSVDYETAMRTAAAATIYGFDTSTIEAFTKIARGAAQVLGGDMTDMMNRLVKGTAKQERELLDELGIMVRVDRAQQTYAASLGKTVNELTMYEQGQAFANAVMEEGLEKYSDLGDSLSNTSPMEKATARIRELSRTFSQFLAKAATPIIVTVTQKTIADTQADDFMSTYDKFNNLVEQSGKQIDQDHAVQGLTLLGQAIQENSKLAKEGEAAIASYNREASRLRGLDEPGGLSDFFLWFTYLGNEESALEKKMTYANANQQDFVQKTNESYSALDSMIQKTAASMGTTAQQLVPMLRDVSVVNDKLVASEKSTASLGNSVDKASVALKGSVTPVEDLANTFRQAYNEAEGLEQLLDTKLASTFPKVAVQIRKALDKLFKGVGATNSDDIALFQQVYQDQADFDRASTQRAVTLAELAASSLDSNISALAVNERSAKIEQQKIDLATWRLSINEKDQEAQDIIYKSQAALIELEKERRDINYTMAQQAIDNESAIRNATLLLSDQTDATLKRLQAEQELLATKKRVAIAGTATDSAAAINARAQAEVALKDAMLDEAKANDQIASKQRMLVGYQADLKQYQAGNVSYQAEIMQAQEDLILATSELDRLNKEGLKYEEQRLDLLKAQADAKRAISEASAKEVLARVEREQVGGSRADSGGVSTELRKQEEARAKVQALYADESTRYTTQYKDAVNELTQATYEYVTALQAKNREEVNTVFGAMGSSAISSTEGLTGQDLTDTLQADSLSNYTAALDTIGSYNPAMTDMITNMGQLTNSFIAFGEGAVSASQLVGPVLNTLGSAMNAASQGAINDIQQQIDMEKKLDGHSEKSKAKIAKMEAEKAALQKKQAIQNITVQTAVGMAMALGSAPPPYNFVLMGAVAAAGLMALKQAQSGNAIASAATTASPESLTLGERSNRVDTSLAATAGESAYIRGDQGTGSIQNFTPRASGGKAYAGTTILAGENGPEPITLGMDATVTKNSDSRKAAAQPIQLNINAVDAKSFRDLLATDPTFIASLVETSLNERGLSLG